MYTKAGKRFKVSLSPHGELLLTYPDGTIESTGVHPSAADMTQLRRMTATTIGQSVLMRIYSRTILDERTKLLRQGPARAMIADALDRLKGHKCRSTVSVLVMDMNDFGRWNKDPAYGHTVGNLVMEWFADILRLRMRRTEITSRWTTGDELVAFSIASDPPASRRTTRDRDQADSDNILLNGEHLADRVLQAAREGTIPYKEEMLRQTVTIGVATALLSPGKVPHDLFDTLFERADEQLRTGKTNGQRDQVHVAELLTF
ncbi:MAG: diguanylate cyclase [Patescibacteria group bacterium]